MQNIHTSLIYPLAVCFKLNTQYLEGAFLACFMLDFKDISLYILTLYTVLNYQFTIVLAISYVESILKVVLTTSYWSGLLLFRLMYNAI